MGKCFSGINQGQRDESDFYQTPYGITQALLDTGVLKQYKYKSKSVMECATGGGAIVRVLENNGFCCVLEREKSTGFDFFDVNSKFDIIITNPPYSQFLEFIHNTFLLEF